MPYAIMELLEIFNGRGAFILGKLHVCRLQVIASDSQGFTRVDPYNSLNLIR